MSEGPSASRATSWRSLAALCGLTRADDLPLLFWPLLWAAWFATAGKPDWSRLAALLFAVLLARSAAWVSYAPDGEALRRVLRERRLLIGLFAGGSLCFALPLGWAGSLVPVALGLVMAWFGVRHRSYLSDPLLAAALSLLPATAWLSQGAAGAKAGGLLWLAAMLWLLAAIMVVPSARGGASLPRLAGPYTSLAVLSLKLAAVAALGMAGWQASLGIFFWLGMGAASGLVLYQWVTARRPTPPSAAVLEAWWGAAVFCAISFHFLCASQMASNL